MWINKYNSPSGRFYDLYADMAKQTHLMIAGATGSGKSVVENGIIATLLYKSPVDVQFILIDPKRVELNRYRHLPHTICYVSEPDTMLSALERAMRIVDERYTEMQKQNVNKYTGGHLYVIIDEFADLMTTQKKAVTPIVQRIAQVGRAANVHLIICTQCPIAEVIPTKIKCNFDSRVGLRTRSAQDSRNILGMTGCEGLPRYGEGFYMTAEGTGLWTIPMVSEAEIERLTAHWMQRENNRRVWRWFR